VIGEPIRIQHYLPSAGGSDESVVLFCGRADATLAAGTHGLAEEHEDIRVVVKTLPEIEALLDAGAIESGHTLIALHWLLRHRDRLRRLWLGSPAPMSAAVQGGSRAADTATANQEPPYPANRSAPPTSAQRQFLEMLG